MARLDELDLDDESEEENVSVEERVKAPGGSSAATPAAAEGEGSGKEDGEGEADEASVTDPRRPLGGGDDKPKRHRPRFTEDHIIGANGMERIYETFPQICRFRGAGHEADDLRRLMRCYKEWAHALFPQLAFEDLLDRVQKLSGRARVRKRLDELREKERERFLASKFGDDYEDRVYEYQKAKKVEEARLEEERRRRREELYGARTKPADGGRGEGQVEVEDLGAEVDLEALERERRARQERIAEELAAKAEARKKEKEAAKAAKRQQERAAKLAARKAAGKGSGSDDSDSDSSSSSSSSSGSSSSSSSAPSPKRARLPPLSSNERLRALVAAMLADGSVRRVRVHEMVVRVRQECRLEDEAQHTDKDIVAAFQTITKQLRGRADDDADAMEEGEGEKEDPTLPMGRQQLRACLAGLLAAAEAVETLSVKAVLQRLQEEFALDGEALATAKPSIKAMVVEMVQQRQEAEAQQQQQRQEEEEEAAGAGAEMETGGDAAAADSAAEADEEDEEEEVDEEATAVAEQVLEPDTLFQLEEEPDTLLAPPAAYGAIEDHIGGGDVLRDMEDMAGLLLSSDDEGEETGAMMEVDGGVGGSGGGGGVSQEY